MLVPNNRNPTAILFLSVYLYHIASNVLIIYQVDLPIFTNLMLSLVIALSAMVTFSRY